MLSDFMVGNFLCEIIIGIVKAYMFEIDVFVSILD